MIKASIFRTHSSWIDRIVNMDRLLLLTVVVPTLLSAVYFGLIASDIYISEARFVVRTPQKQTVTGLGALFQGGGFSRSQDDTYTVNDFIHSRDALKQLDDQFSLGKSFASSNVDRLSRFAGLDWDNSFEALHRYYQKRISLNLDSTSSISTLTVNAFTAEDAYRINEKLLEMSETLVNQLNERGRKDTLEFATREVNEAGKKSREATLALARNQTGGARTSASGDALVSKLTEIQRLTLEKEFADKMLAMAMNSLEQARTDAQRQQLYLERIAQPSRPDIAVEPRRIRNVFVTLILGLIAWGILSMLIAGIKEHKD
jgi:capsular polysaccharide transport system permease protein